MQTAVPSATADPMLATGGDACPLISVIMSNYRGARWLDDAIRAVLQQTHRRLELIIVDDASPDDSLAIIGRAAKGDPRIRVIACETNLGPAGARNRALAVAEGDWIAIMDSDDLIHPERLARMIAAARHLGSDAVADDLIFFGDRPDDGGRTLLQSLALTAPRDLQLAPFLASDNAGTGLPPFGYLKPLIRRDMLLTLRYDPTLRVGEDFDFYARLLASGARFSLIPDAMYLYRRHGGSLSHRLSVDVLEPLLAAHHALAATLFATDPALSQALQDRRAALTWALHYAGLVAALKRRDAMAALRLLMGHPRLVKPLWQSLRERGQTTYARAVITGTAPPLDVVFIPDGATLPPDLAATLAPRALHIAVPHPGMPGTPVAAPPATLAARLSDLSCRHRLHVQAVGRAGVFAAGMLPRTASLQLLAAD